MFIEVARRRVSVRSASFQEIRLPERPLANTPITCSPTSGTPAVMQAAEKGLLGMAHCTEGCSLHKTQAVPSCLLFSPQRGINLPSQRGFHLPSPPAFRAGVIQAEQRPCSLASPSLLMPQKHQRNLKNKNKQTDFQVPSPVLLDKHL